MTHRSRIDAIDNLPHSKQVADGRKQDPFWSFPLEGREFLCQAKILQWSLWLKCFRFRRGSSCFYIKMHITMETCIVVFGMHPSSPSRLLIYPKLPTYEHKTHPAAQTGHSALSPSLFVWNSPEHVFSIFPVLDPYGATHSRLEATFHYYKIVVSDDALLCEPTHTYLKVLIRQTSEVILTSSSVKVLVTSISNLVYTSSLRIQF